ncbi:MAG: PilZ domain-containing protein [Candidatus Competibacteraceae bacterium]
MATPQDNAAAEKRNFKRWQLIFYLRVFDRDTGSLLGHLVDISEGGMMLISEQPIPIDQPFRIYLEVPQDTEPRQHIECDIHSLWSSNDINPDFYDTGFRFTRLTPYTLQQLGLLIADFKTEFKLID